MMNSSRLLSCRLHRSVKILTIWTSFCYLLFRFLDVEIGSTKEIKEVPQLACQFESVKTRNQSVRGNYTGQMEFTVDLTSKETCAPYHKVVFAKTHKTGSSTLQNVFFRYGSENGLTFAMPEKSWMFPFKEPFNSSMVLDLPWAKLGYDIFTFHSIWNYAEIKKVLPTAVYITILRDPVDCFESNYVYMGLQNLYKMDINEFAKFKDSRHMVRPSKAIIGKNQMLWDLGLDWREMENITLVQSKIKDLDSQFHFVLFAEHFDESLVMLAKILCWDLENMRYLKQNMRKAEKVSVISSGARETLSKWLQADYMLYDHFLEKFKRERESYGLEKLATDVRRLELLNLQLKEDCVIEVADNSKLAGEFRRISQEFLRNQSQELGEIVTWVATDFYCNPKRKIRKII
ncbi:galactosylceramide sulfotransferase isoform X2 [Eurytemora carolleeae]|uniref:galactosylceramide sulfotransferase isoform X2 n=1 Tax=Eurytemora carolleeae TaxID=1294199 RepID=UPI000C7780EC|nr:galactosylceramide sulfotransferase isoform X2 [Eurytemora carolleeae]|eukprot:XP_023347052.1 galactosylceramide sulfotransferase-like isoform X2 [Eurytemora affinis]